MESNELHLSEEYLGLDLEELDKLLNSNEPNELEINELNELNELNEINELNEPNKENNKYSKKRYNKHFKPFYELKREDTIGVKKLYDFIFYHKDIVDSTKSETKFSKSSIYCQDALKIYNNLFTTKLIMELPASVAERNNKNSDKSKSRRGPKRKNENGDEIIENKKKTNKTKKGGEEDIRKLMMNEIDSVLNKQSSPSIYDTSSVSSPVRSLSRKDVRDIKKANNAISSIRVGTKFKKPENDNDNNNNNTAPQSNEEATDTTTSKCKYCKRDLDESLTQSKTTIMTCSRSIVCGKCGKLQ